MFIETHADRLIVKNLNTGKEFEFFDLAKAEEFLVEMREDRVGAEWKLYAELCA